MCLVTSHLVEPNPKSTFAIKAFAKGWDAYRIERVWGWLEHRAGGNAVVFDCFHRQNRGMQRS